MNNINNVINKFSKSAKEKNFLYLLKDEDLITYFNYMVNDNKSILLPRYDLEIVCDEESEEYKAIITFDYRKNKFIFNKGLFYIKYFFDKPDFTQYEYNIKIIEFINKIISRIELFNMISDNSTYKNEPIFYSYMIYEFIKNSNFLTKHYIKMRTLQLTSEFINFAYKKNGLNYIKKLEYDLICNKEIIESCNLNQNEYSMDNNFINNAYLDYYLTRSPIFEITDEEIIKYFNQNVCDKFNYTTNSKRRDICFDNTLNCILLGKPLRNPEELLSISSKMSIFEYAKSEREKRVNEFILSLKK